MEGYIVVDMSASICMVDTVHPLASNTPVSDVMHPIADDVIIRCAVVSIMNAGATISRAPGGRNVVNVVPDHAGTRSLIVDSESAAAGDVEPDNVNVVALVPPHRRIAGLEGSQVGAPLLIGDVVDVCRGRSAAGCLEPAVS